MKKIILILLLIVNTTYSGSYVLSQEDKNLLDTTLVSLKNQNIYTELINPLQTASGTLVGGWQDSNYKYSYKMLINQNYRVAMFVMHTIYNANSTLVKILDMQPTMVLLIDANRADNKLVWYGYAHNIDGRYLPPKFPFQ
ncbi:MAG: hypothetical protein U9N49_09960 [Campylobacterota bacterium]|nr:hypothetical protein [Campylobacterota bacterium]